MKRREFLQHIGAAGAVSWIGEDAIADIGPRLFMPPTLPILQGYTTETETQLTVCIGRFASVKYVLIDPVSNKHIEPVSVKSSTYGIALNRVDKIKFTGLQLGRNYNFIVRSDARPGVLDSRFLKTANLENTNARVALMSCMKDFFVAHDTVSSMWKTAEAADVDYIFFIGDAVYGDLGPIRGPLILWNRYIEARLSIPFYHWKNLKPVIAVWDDHDFGIDEGNGEWKHKGAALRHFQNFFAQESDRMNLFKGPGVATYLKAFGQNFFFLDNRYFRGSRTGADTNSFLGERQIEWVTNILSRFPLPTVIMNGAPFFGRHQKASSYEHHAPGELEELLKKLGSTGAPTIFAGGDIHYSEVSLVPQKHLGYESVELISSCMHSNVPDAIYDNANEHVNGLRAENFLILQSQGQAGEASWQVDCMTRGKRLAFSSAISVS